MRGKCQGQALEGKDRFQKIRQRTHRKVGGRLLTKAKEIRTLARCES
jgi:hypothetical protein